MARVSRVPRALLGSNLGSQNIHISLKTRLQPLMAQTFQISKLFLLSPDIFTSVLEVDSSREGAKGVEFLTSRG